MREAYLEGGVDCVTTNTLAQTLSNLGEYRIAEHIGEPSGPGVRIARTAPGRWPAAQRPRCVPGSAGPGAGLPTLGHPEARYFSP